MRAIIRSASVSDRPAGQDDAGDALPRARRASSRHQRVERNAGKDMRALVAVLGLLALIMPGPAKAGDTYWLMDFAYGCREVNLQAAMAQVSYIFRDRRGLRVERFTDEGATVIRVIYVVPGGNGGGSTSVYTSDRRHCLRTIGDYRADEMAFQRGRPLTIGYQPPLGIRVVTNTLLPPTPPPSAYQPRERPTGQVVFAPRPVQPPGG